jgi:hypothetical protein
MPPVSGGPRRRCRAALQHFVAQLEVERQLHALLDHVDADDPVGAQLAAERAGGQAHRTEAGDQHRVVAADADLLQAFVDRAEAAGHLRAIGVGQLGGEMDQVLLLGEQVFRHAAVALPAVGAAVLFAGAGDHVAAAAIVAHPAAGDVIHDHAVAHAEAAAARARLDDLPARLVAGHHALVAFRTLAQVLVIDAADVRAADGGRLHAKQHFAVAGHRNGHLLQFDRAVAGEVCAFHCLIAPSRSQRSSQVWSCFHKKTCPLMRRQFLSMPAMAAMSASVSGGLTTPCRFAR